ncbi:extracellular nuclease [Polaribacter irgensii 23-P]|uniref:Extracellular nuclease n=1 Tax=Polaribacter irgensii 23-P TaxID=313594 RepID=A4BW80_9FLAO|nr:Ig-like domain-containing protein [Polaribacter irgensii]EAR13221.1 extracellular nuclease [Polaribacter irgensii 23-P]
MRNIKKIIMYIGVPLAFFSSILLSCQDDDVVIVRDTELITMAKTINEVDFNDGIENINTDATIVIVFSHTLNPELFSEALTFKSGADAVAYSLVFSNTNSTVTFTPDSKLLHETGYALLLPAGNYTLEGKTFDAPLSLNFITAAFVPPVVSISSDVNELEENNATATITASLDRISQKDVSAMITIAGTAISGVDYNISGNINITIPAGNLAAVITITTILDDENEGNESIVLSLEDAVNANGNSTGLTIIIKEALSAISLKGVFSLTWDGQGSSNEGKAIHLVANVDIADLSIYGLGVANNGGGTDGLEYTFPAQAVTAGDNILVAREPELISAYFGACVSEFQYVLLANTSISQNGDDAIELFSGTTVIETYGDVDLDGTGEAWEYTGSWAYKFEGVWSSGGIDCSIGASTMQTSSCVYPICTPALSIQGVMALLWEGSGTNGGKALHLKAQRDIADLSIYSTSIANNGGGSDGIEFTLPAISVSEGDDILLARETATLSNYFGSCITSFEYVIETSSLNQNGDDAIELYQGNDVIETYGDVIPDGTGEPWEYTGTWAYKINGSWVNGALDCAAGSTSTQNSACVYPACD